MTPINVVAALTFAVLLLVLVVLILACVASHQREHLRDLIADRDAAQVFARNVQADLDSVRTRNYELAAELHEAQQLIEAFIPDDLSKEAS